MLVHRLLVINREFPFYNYYLDLVGYLIDEVYLHWKDSENILFLDKKIQEIEETLANATSTYREDQNPKNKTWVKRAGFLSKREKMKIRVTELKACCQKKKLKKLMG